MKMSIERFAERLQNGEFISPSRRVQCEAGWYDWFCKDSALARKTEFLGNKVLAIMNSKRFDKKKCYVFFKNNCPCVGPLYDQFSICDIETGDVLFCVQHLNKGSHGCDRAHWELYDFVSDVEDENVITNGTWSDVKKYFMNK